MLVSSVRAVLDEEVDLLEAAILDAGSTFSSTMAEFLVEILEVLFMGEGVAWLGLVPFVMKKFELR